MEAFKSVPQILGLQRRPSVNRKTGRVARHRASNPRGLCCEAAPEERTSMSETLDRSRTKLNVSRGPASGEELWDSIVAEADAARVRTVARDGTEHERGLRRDAVIAYAYVDHPPAEVSDLWDDETAERFFRDSQDSMNDVLASMGRPRIFGGDNERATYLHRDEGVPPGDDARHPAVAAGIPGVHAHRFDTCRDPETGAWCGSIIDAKFLHELNANYPRLMRERGWPLLDLDVTDVGRMATDEGYAEERRRRRARHGRSTNEYRAALAEERLASADEAYGVIADASERVAAERDAARAEAERHLERGRALVDAIERMTTGEGVTISDERGERFVPSVSAVEREVAQRQADAQALADAADDADEYAARTRKAADDDAERRRRESERERRAADEAAAKERARRDAEAERTRKAADAAARRRREDEERAADEAEALADAFREAVEELEHGTEGVDWREDDGSVWHQRTLPQVTAEIDAKQEELAGVEERIAEARERLEVATSRGPLKLADGVAAVVDAVADALEGARMAGVAAWVRSRADDLRERAIDRLAPETKRNLADAPEEPREPGEDEHTDEVQA